MRQVFETVLRVAERVCLAALLAGCGSTWQALDEDGDGYSILQGDCDDTPSGRGVGPGVDEIWYNGVDENCDGNDGDQDGDGFLSVQVAGDDCWDQPDAIPGEFAALNGFPQPAAADVNPAAPIDEWYDGVDADCDGSDDFDQDGDGFASTAWADVRSGLPLSDCYDADTEVYPADDHCIVEVGSTLTPASIHPDAADTWYDGTDADCGGDDDFDQDGDTYSACNECDDLDATVFPNDAEEIWYNHIDENCDGNDADKDGDGYIATDYVEADPEDPIHEFYGTGDCFDDAATRAPEQEAINGFGDPDAADVNPAATEVWYDGVDEDCGGDNDFDQDADAHTTEIYADRDGLSGDDCDDLDGKIYGGAPDTWYDGIDADCAGNSDYDQDSDGHDADGYGVPGSDDCDDLKASVNPDENEDCATTDDENCDGNLNDDEATGCLDFWADDDGDGYGDYNDSRCLCEEEGAYNVTGVTLANDDCDDTKSAVSPGASNEDCTTTYDDDCDGGTNEQNGTGCTTYYLDADGDTYGATASQCWCAESGNYNVVNDDDCDDSRATVNPAVAKESCSTTYDDDCDGSTNEKNATNCSTWYYDADSDGYGTASSQCWCAASGDYKVSNDDDCDGSDSNTFPGAASLDSGSACMTDVDGDNYGDSSPASGVTAGTDCDDASSTVKPSATETCSTSYDDDCDGSINDIGATGCTTYYSDGDNDSFGNATLSQCTCTTSGSYDVTNSTDCDDADADTFPGAAPNDSATACENDDDADDYGDTTVAATVTAGTDCDDTKSTVKPSATETCSTTYDDDCDSSSNDVGATGCTTYYRDADSDTYGAAATTSCRCTLPSGYVANSTDCDDTKSAVSPVGTETCATSYDDDCDGSTNDVGATSCTTYYYDGDADGYGLLTTTQCTCTSSGLYTATSVTSANDDCDDTRSAVSPVGTETCSTTYDDDCDSSTNDVGATGCTTYYYDGDSDGYGLLTSTQCTCTSAGLYTLTGVTSANDDCDDTRSAVSPIGTETCGTTYDDDCDGSTNDVGATSCITYYYDGDADGYGLLTTTQCTCSASGLYTATSVTSANDDCDDTKSAVSPVGTETCVTTYDDDCDGSTNDVGATSCVTYYYDGDADGYGLLTSTQCTCTSTGLYTSTSVTSANDDCDDTLAAVNPAGTETCVTTYDDDCDGSTNDVGATSCITYYYDGDADGYGLLTSTQCTCSASGLYTATSVTSANDDCDDTLAAVSPAGTETCATVYDDDCDGSANDVGATSCTTYYYDGDADGYGLSTTSQCTCSASGSYSTTDSTDCDDSVGTIHPGASDPVATGDQIDQDCDTFIDEDGVGYGDIVLTEFQANGALTADWFEIYNAGLYDITLDRWTVSLCHEAATGMATPPFLADTDCDSTVILDLNSDSATPMTLGAGEYMVLCYSPGHFTVSSSCDDRWQDYDTPTYASTNDLEAYLGGILIELDATTVDEVTWWQDSTGNDDWPISTVGSIQLDIDAINSATDLAADLNDDYGTSNNTFDIWCASSGLTGATTYSTGYDGTPGTVNLDCGP